MFERFTNRARRVIVLAQEEARLLSHHYLGTEHILLGLINEAEGVLRVTRHEHVVSLTVIMAGTVILWLVATAS